MIVDIHYTLFYFLLFLEPLSLEEWDLDIPFNTFRSPPIDTLACAACIRESGLEQQVRHQSRHTRDHRNKDAIHASRSRAAATRRFAVARSRCATS